MNHLDRLHDLLPPPYSIADDAVLSEMLAIVAAEMEAFLEDLDRMRQTHWINFCYRLEDAEKLGTLVGVQRLDWEDLRVFRVRLLATVTARLNGALGPNEIRKFVFNYLHDCETVTAASLVPGLQTVTLDEAYQGPNGRPLFRKLELVENPSIRRESPVLASRGGNVPYLFRWEEQNHGLDDSTVRIDLSGMIGRRTIAPVIVNLTTGDLIGFRERIGFGRNLVIDISGADEGSPRLAKATLDGADVTASLFSMDGFVMGTPFLPEQLAPKPLVPRMVRGVNEWVFLSVGEYDIRGLNRFFSSIANDNLREAVFNETKFGQALFPSGTIAKLALSWEETQPATFEIRVPQYIVVEPPDSDLHDLVAQGLEETIAQLKVAGVRSVVRRVPFEETQAQAISVMLPWIVPELQKGTAGEQDDFSLGGQFGESPLGNTRFE